MPNEEQITNEIYLSWDMAYESMTLVATIHNSNSVTLMISVIRLYDIWKLSSHSLPNVFMNVIPLITIENTIINSGALLYI